MSVPIGSETMKSGEYWVKEDKGLRIYSSLMMFGMRTLQ